MQIFGFKNFQEAILLALNLQYSINSFAKGIARILALCVIYTWYFARTAIIPNFWHILTQPTLPLWAMDNGHSKISIITGFFLSVAFASVPNQPYCLKYEGKILNNEKFSQNASPVIAPDILGIIFPIYAKNCINLQEKINFPAS